MRAWLSWSSGKDSTMALHEVRRTGDVEIVGLLTTVNSAAGRVAMHAVRRSLLEAQAKALWLPVHVVELAWPCSNEAYEELMAVAVRHAVDDGVTHIVFGDLFLADVRAYREQALAPTGITPVFPLWQRPTAELAKEMLGTGIRALVTCVDPAQLDPSFVGRPYDETFLADLPRSVDPCGERGEFHTFVWDAPGFRSPIDVECGEIVERDGFFFCDVVSDRDLVGRDERSQS